MATEKPVGNPNKKVLANGTRLLTNRGAKEIAGPSEEGKKGTKKK